MTGPDLSTYHERTRTRGVNVYLCWAVRAVLQPFFHAYFRLARIGREHIPEGGVILASNHRSFLDPWVVGTCVRRPIYFFAKQELFENRLQAWFLNALGAFPVRRGEADEEALATVRILLERGEALVVFPEGTRRLAAAVTERVWPCVQLQWEWLGGEPPPDRPELTPARIAA